MLWLLWLVFAILFAILSYLNWRASLRKIKPFSLSKRPMSNPTSGVYTEIKMGGVDIDKPLNDFISDFNRYIDTYNNSQKRQNGFQAIGFLIAALTSIVSMFIA